MAVAELPPYVHGGRCPLTPRQLEALKLTAEGKSATEVGLAMHAAYGTVVQHLADARERTNTRTNAELVGLAERRGWL